MTYEQYRQVANDAYRYVKSALTKGAGNRVLGDQPGFIWERRRCVNAMREVTTPLQKQMDDQLTKRMVAFAEKTWGRDETGRFRAHQGTLDLYATVQIMNAMAGAIELNAKAALISKCGNCEEFSSLTFKYLKDRSVRPLDWMAVQGSFGTSFGNHAFVIVGRDKKTTAGDVSTWNKEVVWCDPYEGQLGGLDLIKERFGGEKIRLLHRWDVFTS